MARRQQQHREQKSTRLLSRAEAVSMRKNGEPVDVILPQRMSSQMNLIISAKDNKNRGQKSRPCHAKICSASRCFLCSSIPKRPGPLRSRYQQHQPPTRSNGIVVTRNLETMKSKPQSTMKPGHPKPCAHLVVRTQGKTMEPPAVEAAEAQRQTV